MNRSEKSRQTVERIVIEGILKLLTPTSLSNGAADGLTDISLIKDEFSGNALLTGTSICGALRNYLRECENGFNNTKESDIAFKLFGSHEDDAAQSLLIIDDAISTEKPKTELRDGVKICGKTRTAEEGKKFDLELLESGTKFPLRFELLICEQRRNEGETAEEVKANTDKFKKKLVSAFATALQGFELGEIHLGGRKRRGYGECKVENWKVRCYELNKKESLLDWLKYGGIELEKHPANKQVEIEKGKIEMTLKVTVDPNADIRNYFELNAWFAINGSILIRSGSKILNDQDKPIDYQPDSVHLRSNGKPIISGTSLAGVLRHRATKIVNTLKFNDDGKFVESMFGVDMEELKKRNKVNNTKETPFASRLEVSETVIKNTNDLVHTRVKIDRFTGGAFDSALFDAAPVFSDGEREAVNLKLRLRNAEPCEIGLILLLLKDLWTSDLAVGGESSIGRGRLKGKTASLNYKSVSENWAVCLSENSNKEIAVAGNKDSIYLNDLVSKHLKERLEKLVQNNG